MPTSRGPGRSPSKPGTGGRAAAKRRTSGRATGSSRPRQAGGAGGSRPAPRTRRRTEGADSIRRTTRPRSMRRLVVLGVIVGFLAVILTPTVRAYLEQRGEISQLQEQVEQQRQDVADAEADIEAWNDPDFLERQARERLNFVRPGERSYTVLDDTSQELTSPAPGVAPVTEDVQQNRPWYGQLWESVEAANEGVPPGPESGDGTGPRPDE